MRHVLPLYHVYHVSGTRADAVVFFSRRCSGVSPPLVTLKFKLSDLEETDLGAYTQWFEQWLRGGQQAFPAIGAAPAGDRPPPAVGEREPAPSGSGDYVVPRRYWRVVKSSYSSPQQESMQGRSSRVGKVEGAESESVGLELPDGAFAGPGKAPRAALVPRVRDTCLRRHV